MTAAEMTGAFNTWDATIVRCLVLVASALVGGVALLRPLTGPVNTATRRLVAVAAATAVAGVVEVAAAGRAPWSFAVFQGLVTLAVPLAVRGWVAAAGGLVLTAAIAVEAGSSGQHWVDAAAGVAHTGAAAVWLGAAVIVAVADPGTRRPLLRRLAPVAVGAAVLVAATGTVQAWRAGLRLDATIAESAFARVLALKAALMVGVAVLGVSGYRRLVGVGAGAGGRGTVDRGTVTWPAVVLLRISAIGLTGALVAGAALAAVEAPPAPPVPGVPLLRTAAVGDERLPVVVAPQRPGWNLVHVGTGGAMVGVDRDHLVPATTRSAAAGGWALVPLPAGGSRLWLRHGGRLTSLRLDTGRLDTGRLDTGSAGKAAPPAAGFTGPDGPECMSAVLGALVAGRDGGPVACPADRLADADAGSLRALVKYLAGRGVRAVTVLDDPSPRSRAAAELVREAAARHQLTVTPVPRADSAMIVVAGWAVADGALRAVASGETAGLGTYLAPWLANAGLLTYRSGAVVALRYDPRDPTSLRYANVLSARFPGEAATAAGYEAWRAATDQAAIGPTHLYAAATISILPDESGHQHGVPGGWLPGGAITRVTPALED